MSNATPTLQGYGYVSDSDESLQPKVGGKFGINFGATITKFAYNPNVAKDGEPVREAIEVVVKIGDKEFKDWISPITQVYVDKVKHTAPFTDPAAINKFNEEMNQQGALVTHYLKAVGGNEEMLKNVLSASPITSFADYANRVCNLFGPYASKLVDVFLEYQWNFGKKADGSLNDKTYPTLPGNMKGGYFIVPAQQGNFVENRDGGALKYVNQNNVEHPIHRTEDFMKSRKGYQQIEGQDAPQANAAFTPVAGAAQTSSWDTPGAGAPTN